MDDVMIAAYQYKIRELETRNVELERVILACDQKMKNAAACMEPMIRRLEQKLTKLRTPCQCETPGSGEFCNGCCRVRAGLLAQLEPPARGLAMLALDNVVAEIIAIGRADETP